MINYELPQDLEFYIHRVGRTARGNYDGMAITLYDSKEEELLQQLEARGIEFNYRESKKVTPGYKKKMKAQMEQVKRQERRKRK